MKKEWKIDVPVLLIFFARPDTLEKVFESIREARPSTLLLWQDGPREGRADDIENIEKCRKIVENIDWECTVYKKYNEKNYGCDPSTFYSHKWAFSLVNVEAQACGTPVVTYRNTGAQETVDNKCSFSVENGNEKEFFEAIMKIKEKGKEKFSENCVTWVKENFDRDENYKKYIELYRGIK